MNADSRSTQQIEPSWLRAILMNEITEKQYDKLAKVCLWYGCTVYVLFNGLSLATILVGSSAGTP